MDADPVDTERTRIRLLSQSARDGGQVLAYHMTGIGHVERARDAFTFVRDPAPLASVGR